jgi:hypothetical protein
MLKKLLFISLFLLVNISQAAQFTETFTDSQGRTTLYRYSIKDGWDTTIPRGALIYFHGNNSNTQQEVIDMFFWSTEQDAYQRNLIPIVVTSPQTRPDGVTRQWYDEDKKLIQELLQSNFKNAFKLDFNRLIFSGASQGTCFLHDFIMQYGEQYGGGFYAGCGCFNSPNPVWTPSETFKNRFKVFVHATTEDFLFESSQKGYGYYKYILELNTRGDFKRTGTHCSATNEIEKNAYDWLLGLKEVSDVPFEPHWKRISSMNEIKGLVFEENGSLLVLQQSNTNQASLWRSSNNGVNWSLVKQFNEQPNYMINLGKNIFVALKSGLYRSTDNGATFQLVSQQTSILYATDSSNRLYSAGNSPLQVSNDFGKTWNYLKANNDFIFIPAYSDIFNTADSRLFLATGYTDNLSYISSNQGNSWTSLKNTALGAPFSVALDRNKLWGLSSNENSYYRLFQSTDFGTTWTAVNLPAQMNEYFYWGAKVDVLNTGEMWLYGGGNISWNSADQGQNWARIYGAETISNGKIFQLNQQLYLTDGRGIFTLVRQPESATNPTPTTPDWQRVMNWAETMLPQWFFASNKQELTISPYLIRYYPQTNVYLGYNPQDNHFYGYAKDSWGDQIQQFGLLSEYLPVAQQAGF